MSISENSTLSPSSGNGDGAFQLLDGHAYGVGGLPVNSYPKSPYIGQELYSLDVGPNKTRFCVHRTVLSQSPELEVKPSSQLWGEKADAAIALPDLDEGPAHTLVHYLYTGTYQMPQPLEDAETKTSSLSSYKLGTCVYCAAVRYKLPGLAELAKKKIESFAEVLTIFDILGVAREHAFPHLPKTETWYPAYLEAAINKAVLQDPKLAIKPEFTDQIEGDKKFRQVVMNAVVNTYSTVILGGRNTGLSTPVTEPQELPRLETEGVKSGSEEPQPQVEETDETAAPSLASEPEELTLDEIEPTPQPSADLEPYTDELGFGTTKTYQKMEKKAEEPDTATKVPEEKPAHVRADSGVQVSDSPVAVQLVSTGVNTENIHGKTDVLKELEELEQSAAAETPATPKKKNKRNKKKGASATVNTGTA